MIRRKQHIDAVLKRLRAFPVAGILGPRQIGKTTLARQVGREYPGTTHWLDLESPADLNRLTEDPGLVLDGLRGLVVIDEVQRRPDRFPILRVPADRRPRRARFLVLGSASPDLLRQSSKSLAGRINYYRLGGARSRRGRPRPYRPALATRWLSGSLARPVEPERLSLARKLRADVPGARPAGARHPCPRTNPPTFLDHAGPLAWTDLELVQVRAFARGGGHHGARYLDILTGALVVRQLQPWHASIAKRQVNASKVYLRDTGVLHALLGIDGTQSLNSHANTDRLNLEDEHAHFWAAQTGAELDLLITRRRKRIGIEIKRTTAPKVTPSIHSALRDLGLAEVIVVQAGSPTRSGPKFVESRRSGWIRIWACSPGSLASH